MTVSAFKNQIQTRKRRKVHIISVDKSPLNPQASQTVESAPRKSPWWRRLPWQNKETPVAVQPAPKPSTKPPIQPAPPAREPARASSQVASPPQAEPSSSTPRRQPVANTAPQVAERPQAKPDAAPRRRRSGANKASQGAEQPHPEPVSDPGGHWFGEIEIGADVSRALKEIGYEDPTPIQLRCISPLLSGQDVVGQALTGTGKTAAFGIPLVQNASGAQNTVQALVLVPTRELAQQVRDELVRLARFRGLGVVACYGGQAISTQINAMDKRAQIIVGTPGRVLDHLHRRTLRLDNLQTLILDEADEMLDIGFLPDIERILSYTPQTRQTALFSATIPSPIQRMVNRHLKSPLWVRIGGEIETAPNVTQLYYEVLERDRVRAVAELVRDREAGGKVLLFCRTQIGVDQLVRALQRENLAGDGIHGGLPQSKRNSVMGAFRDGRLDMLVATNVAARGLDIPLVSHVVNYDMPQNLEEYVHRIGRTARMGKEGMAITLVTEWDLPMLDYLVEGLDGELKPGKLALYEVSK